MRGPGIEDDRDELSARREGSLRTLPWRALHRLVDAGNNVCGIDQNLRAIADADGITARGPEAASPGVRVGAQGSVDAIPSRPVGSHPATLLAEFLQTRRRPQTANEVA